MVRVGSIRALAAVMAVFILGACEDERIAGPTTAPPQLDIASVTVTPDRAAIEVGETVQYEAVALDSRGQAVPVPVQWTTSDGAIATVSESGLLQAHTEGAATVTASVPLSTTVGTAGLEVVPEGSIVISEKAVVVDSTRWVLISDSTELAAGTYRFQIMGSGGLTRGPTDTTSVVEGDFITGGQGYGFLREVMSVTRSDDIVTVQTTQAALADVVLKADFDHSFPINEPEGTSRGTLEVQPADITPLVPGVAPSLSASGGISLDGIDFDKVEICGDLPKKGPEVCFEAGFEITEGEIRFVPNVGITGGSGGGVLKRLGFRNGGTLRLDADIEFSVAVKAGYSLPDSLNVEQDPDGDGKKNKQKIFDKELFQASTKFSFFLGYLPVFGRVIFNVSLDGEAVAGIEATWTTGVHIAYETQGGLEWDGSRWRDDAPLVPRPTYEEDEFVFDGVKGIGEIQVSVVPELNLELYGVIGPFIELEPYAKVEGEVNVLTGDANAQLLFGTDLNLGFKTNDDVKDLTGIGVDYTALGIPLFKERKAIEVFTNNPLDVTVAAASTNGDPAALPARGFSLDLGPSAPEKVDAPWWNIFHSDVGCRTESNAPGPHRFGNTVCNPEFAFLGPAPTDVAVYDRLRTGLEHRLVIDKGGARNCAYVGEGLPDPYYRIVTDDSVAVEAGPFKRGQREFTLDCVPWGQLDVSVSATGAPEDYGSGFVLYTGDLTLRTDTMPAVSPADPFTREFYQEELGDSVMFGGSITSGMTRSFNAIFGTLAVLEVPTNCTVLPGGGRSLPYFDSLFIASEQVAQVHFDVDCLPLPDVTISTTTECSPTGQPCFTDPDGYELQLRRPPIPDQRGWGDPMSPRRTTPTNFTPAQDVGAAMLDHDTVVFAHMHGHDDYEVTLDEVASSCRVDSGFMDSNHGTPNTWTGDTRLATRADGSDSELEIRVVCEGYPPQGVQALALADSAVEIRWNRTTAPEVGGVAGHWVYRDGVLVSPLVGFGDPNDTFDSFIDYGVTGDSAYTYTVSMQATDGRAGAESQPVSVTTPPPPDRTPPSAPTNLRTLDVGMLDVRLAWGASTDLESGVSHYVVLREGAQVGHVSDTIFTDTGLQATTAYRYEVYAVNGDGFAGATSQPLTVTTTDDTTPPSAPSALRTTATTPFSVSLAWNAAADPQSGIASYEIERDGAVITSVTALTFTDTGVQPSQTYAYEAFAVNGSALRSAGSGVLDVTTPPGPTVPTAPSQLAATAQSQTEIQLTWSDNADNEIAFDLEVSLDGGSTWATRATLGPNSQSYLDTGLVAATSYSYRVQARNGAGSSAFSNVASATTDPAPTPPSAPTSLTAVLQGTDAASLSWTDNADNEDAYYVERSPDLGMTWAEIAALGVDAGSFLDQPLVGNSVFTYRVRACNVAGCSQYSDTASLVTPDDTPPSAPTGLTVGAEERTGVALSWQAAADPESGVSRYLLYRDGVKVDSTTSLTIFDGGLTESTTYTYEVSAVNGAGLEGPRSAPVTATTTGMTEMASAGDLEGGRGGGVPRDVERGNVLWAPQYRAPLAAR